MTNIYIDENKKQVVDMFVFSVFSKFRPSKDIIKNEVIRLYVTYSQSSNQEEHVHTKKFNIRQR